MGGKMRLGLEWDMLHGCKETPSRPPTDRCKERWQAYGVESGMVGVEGRAGAH